MKAVRVMKGKLYLKAAAAAGCGLLLAGGCCWLAMLYANQRMHLCTVYAAARDILPRQQVQPQDLTEIHIPSAYVLEGVCTDPDAVIGRYTEIQGMIPKGSLFHERMLKPAEQLPDHPEAQLLADQAVYALETDLAGAAGNSLVPGQRADLHVLIERRNEPPLTDCLIRNARILSICDHRGLDVADEKSSGIPYLISIAVSREDLNLISLADQAGTIRLFASAAAYDVSREAERKPDSLVLPYLLGELAAESRSAGGNPE
jgi:Flp pilus assembly protein CpaB